MFFDFSSIWDNFSVQAYILLAIVGLIVVIVAVLSQGIGRAIAIGVGIVVIAGIIAIFGNLEAIGKWFNDTFINIGAPTASIQQYKSYVLSCIQFRPNM